MPNISVKQEAMSRLEQLGAGLEIVPASQFQQQFGGSLEGANEQTNLQAPSPQVQVAPPELEQETVAQINIPDPTIQGANPAIASPQVATNPPISPAMDFTGLQDILLAQANLPQDQQVLPPGQEPLPVEQESPLIKSFQQRANTLPVKNNSGMRPLNPIDLPQVGEILSLEYLSMTETGIVIDPQERISYVTAVMANDALRSDVKAQLVDQAMRDGKIMPEALPAAFFESRGLLLLPPDITEEDLRRAR